MIFIILISRPFRTILNYFKMTSSDQIMIKVPADDKIRIFCYYIHIERLTLNASVKIITEQNPIIYMGKNHEIVMMQE
jgi:hypothetical protein